MCVCVRACVRARVCVCVCITAQLERAGGMRPFEFFGQVNALWPSWILKGALQLLSNRSKLIRFAQVPERNSVSSS